MGPSWDRQGPGGPHVGPMNFAIWVLKGVLVNPAPELNYTHPNSHFWPFCDTLPVTNKPLISYFFHFVMYFSKKLLEKWTHLRDLLLFKSGSSRSVMPLLSSESRWTEITWKELYLIWYGKSCIYQVVGNIFAQRWMDVLCVMSWLDKTNLIDNPAWKLVLGSWYSDYRQTSNISGTKSQNLNVSGLVLQLSLHNLLKQGVKSRMNM